MVAMAMFVLFTGLIAFGLYSLIRMIFRKFKDRVDTLVNAAEVASDAFRFAATGDSSIKES